MLKCDKCNKEYKEGINNCPECGNELILSKDKTSIIELSSLISLLLGSIIFVVSVIVNVIKYEYGILIHRVSDSPNYYNSIFIYISCVLIVISLITMIISRIVKPNGKLGKGLMIFYIIISLIFVLLFIIIGIKEYLL